MFCPVFKIFSCGPGDPLEERGNLRPGNNRSVNLDYSCTDVAWHWADENRLATSATNGAVILWKLRQGSGEDVGCGGAGGGGDRTARKDVVFSEHCRTAHKVMICFLRRRKGH